MTKVAVVFADGFEEIEAVSIVDVLRRADLEVLATGIAGRQVTGAHGLCFGMDTVLSELPDDLDAVVLPGGMPGAANLAANQGVLELLRRTCAAGKHVAAICAAPMVLAAAGLLDGVKATCYPGFENKMLRANCTGSRVEVDGGIITGIGPGAALDFALRLVAELGYPDRARQLQQQMLVASPQTLIGKEDND